MKEGQQKIVQPSAGAIFSTSRPVQARRCDKQSQEFVACPAKDATKERDVLPTSVAPKSRNFFVKLIMFQSIFEISLVAWLKTHTICHVLFCKQESLLLHSSLQVFFLERSDLFQSMCHIFCALFSFLIVCSAAGRSLTDFQKGETIQKLFLKATPERV